MSNHVTELVERLQGLEQRLMRASFRESVDDETQSEIRMLFNEALAGGPNMNGDGGPVLSRSHAIDCVWSTMRIAELQLRVDALEKATLPCDVILSPTTTIRAGCKVTTLLIALELRAAWRQQLISNNGNEETSCPN